LRKTWWSLNKSLYLVLIPMLVLLCACSSQEPSQTVTIKFSTWGSTQELSVVKNLIRQFEQQHPHIHVDLIHIPENYFQKLHILIAGDLAPDVMFVNSLNFPIYAENNILEPLNIDSTQFFPAALKAFQWHGRLYAIPRDVSDLVVFYNKTLFKRAGISEPKSDWTLDDMLKISHKLTQPGQFGFSFNAKPPFLWLPFVWSNGGDIFDANFSRFTLTQPEAIRAVQFYADLRNRWHVAPTRMEVGNATMSQLFLQQKLAMMISGRWSVPILREQAGFQWDIVPFPSGKAGSVVSIDASGYAMSHAGMHKTESWELISFLSSRQAQQQLAQSGLIVPARKDAASLEKGNYFLKAMERGLPTHTPVRWNEINEELTLALEPVWDGTESADQALKTVAPKIEKLLR